MPKPKIQQKKKIKAWIVVGADGQPNWLLHRPEIYGVKARAKDYNFGIMDKIIPCEITYSLPKK